MSRRPPSGQSARGGPPPRRPPTASRPPVRRAPPPRSTNNQTPLIVGGIMGILLLGLVVVFVLTSQNNNGSGTTTNPPTVPAGATAVSQPGAATATGSDPPRISLEAFKKMYDDPSTRPMIIDVRTADVYAQGHIVGAISFPESDVDARINEIPKDKLVIAYCQ